VNKVVNEMRQHYTPAWRLSDEAMVGLEQTLNTYRPESIIEFGPGWSSWLLHQYAVDAGASLWTVDHEGAFADEHLTRLQQHGFNTSKHIICRLSQGDKFYLPEDMAPLHGRTFGLIVLDGPVGGRDSKSAMVTYSEIAKPKSLWLIDDTHRPSERAVAASIAKHQGCVIMEIYDGSFPRSSIILIPRTTTLNTSVGGK
jgi:hypothetical protein